MNAEEISLEEQSDCDRCFKHFDIYDDNLIYQQTVEDGEEFTGHFERECWKPKKGKLTHEDMVKAFEKESEASALCMKCIRELK